MFMMFWKPILKAKAEQVVFLAKGQDLSVDVNEKYNEMKNGLQKIIERINNEPDHTECVEICKKMLLLYSTCEELLQNIVFEFFRESFIKNIGKKECLFVVSNKIFKIMMLYDLLKAKNPWIFAKYTEMRIKMEKDFWKLVDEQEDVKISVLNMISMPMGRLFLSMFTSSIFDIEIPEFLGKISKIYLDIEFQKRLFIYIYLSEIHQWKYLHVFLVALLTRVVGNNYDLKDEQFHNYLEYLELLKEQL